MAETSRSRVTITLGRSGQVVKRAGPVSDVGFSDSQPAVGTKRSVRDRLGSDVDNSSLHRSQLDNKRQRGDSNTLSLRSNGVDDLRIGKDDLRYKIMQKSVIRQAQSDDGQKVMDLREKLSRTVQSPSSSLDTRQRMPDTRDTGILARIPPTRSADNLPRMDPLRNSYSAWTLDHLRRRSPDGSLGTSRGLSPQRKVEDIQKRPLIRTYEDIRSVPYTSKDVLDSTRPMSNQGFLTQATALNSSAKPAAPLAAQLPPPSGVVQKSTYKGDEQPTVDSLLHSLGLGKYAIYFKAEEVDMTALKQMGDNDLKELGIPMGPRKKILLAVLPRSKRQL
ncbi:hypothetical protein L1049_006085 [Liquidambar formosana]|uniref:SAM domain-containing protein n=1 Tax=Liquidambar formosana TaxID=63359 RepID=A0AAP0WSW2_LIQFO